MRRITPVLLLAAALVLGACDGGGMNRTQQTTALGALGGGALGGLVGSFSGNAGLGALLGAGAGGVGGYLYDQSQRRRSPYYGY
jgi:uncharacterized membrane protein